MSKRGVAYQPLIDAVGMGKLPPHQALLGAVVCQARLDASGHVNHCPRMLGRKRLPVQRRLEDEARDWLASEAAVFALALLGLSPDLLSFGG